MNSNKTMDTLLLAAALCAAGPAALADEAAGATHQFSGTATLASDYIFRGMTQTWHRPAVQASVDYAHASGLYASLWASNVSRKVIAGARTEVDVVLGYRGTFAQDWSYGAGSISIFYPGGNWNKVRWASYGDKRYDFTEVNAFVGYRFVTVKYSRTLNDLFGFSEAAGFSGSTRGSAYVEVNADVPLADTGLVLGLHAGRQDVKATVGGIDPDFTDYRVSLGMAFAPGWNASVQLSENRNTAFLDGTASNLDANDRRDVGKRRVALLVTRAF